MKTAIINSTLSVVSEHSVASNHCRTSAPSRQLSGHSFCRNLDRRQAAIAIQSIEAVWKAVQELSPTDGGSFHASQTMIADRAVKYTARKSVSRQLVSKCIKVLCEMGMLEVVEKKVSIPLPRDKWKRFATVYRIRPRPNNLTLPLRKVNTEEREESCVEKNIRVNLSKSRCDFDSEISSKRKTESDNTESQDFSRFFVESQDRWKSWRRDRRERLRAETEKLRASILEKLALQDSPRFEVSAADAATFNVPQPHDRPRDFCGHKLRLSICRQPGKLCGLAFWHCPKCGHTYGFRVIHESHYFNPRHCPELRPTVDAEAERRREEEFRRRCRRERAIEEKERRERLRGKWISLADGSMVPMASQVGVGIFRK